MIMNEKHEASNCFSNCNVDKGYLKFLLDSNDAEDHVALYLIIEDLIKQPRCCILKYLFFEELKAKILNSREQKLEPEMIKSMLGVICELNSVDYVDSNGLSFLHIGCFYGHTRMVEKYLNKGSVNAQWVFGNEGHQNCFTPLHLAVMNSSNKAIDIVKLLLWHNAHVNAKDFQGQTSLHIASLIKLDAEAYLILNELDVMDALLEKNGDVNAQDKLGNTPLFNVLPHHLKDPESSSNVCFSHSSHLTKADRKLKLLLAYSPNLAITNNEGENILHYIVGNLCYSSFSSLNSVDKYHVIKASYQHFTLVQLLEEIFKSNLECNVNQRDNAGYTPLQIALLSMNTDVFEILVNNGADLKHIKFDFEDTNYISFHRKFLPDLKTITSLLNILELLSQKEFELTVEDNLAIVKFFTHGGNDCMCGYSFLGCADGHYSDSLLISNLINYGSPSHINYILNGHSYMCSTSHNRFIVYNELKQYLECTRLTKAYISKETEYIIDRYLKSWDNPNYRYKTPDIASDLRILKSIRLTENINMLDIIRKDPKNISYHILKNNFNHELTQDLKFFKNIVKGHIAKCFIRYHIERLSIYFSEKLFHFSLLDLCYRKIVSYLENEDISNICQAALLGNSSVNLIKP